MKKTVIALSVIAAVTLTGCGMHSCKAQMNNKHHQAKKASKPFLILGKMPHMTKVVKMHWEDTTLNLTAEQKTKLIVVRKDTMTQAKALGKQINALEMQVAQAIKTGATPTALKPKVDTIASLKAEATQVHLTCIYNTQNILNKEQLTYLFPSK